MENEFLKGKKILIVEDDLSSRLYLNKILEKAGVVLFNAGAHVPVIPLLDVVGSAERVAPEQIGATAVNVGVTFGLTVIVNVAVVAH